VAGSGFIHTFLTDFGADKNIGATLYV